jgi:SpoIID/LytB domain protein
MKLNNWLKVDNRWLISSKFCLTLPLLATTFLLASENKPVSALDIKVGIVQRFGDELKDQITLQSNQDDSLSIKFTDSKTKTSHTLTAKEITLGIAAQKIPEKYIQERLILGDHGTFETAEDDAKRWQSLGIDVEITQPGRWQVWAKRSTYDTPFLKRMLLKKLQAAGYSNIYIETEVLWEKPQVSFQIDKQTYQTSYLEVKSTKGLVKIKDDSNGKGKWLNYGGSFTIQPNAYGDYTLVNKVDIETYLRGVVPHEIGSNAPLAAAQAQTIIARTYALRNTRRFQADNYELCATTHCQVYYGLSGTSSISDQAISSTAGLVLTYNNELVDALYSSTSGGITSYFSDVWNGDNRPYLKPVVDSPKALWNFEQNNLQSEENFKRFISLNQGFNETGRSLFRWNKKSTLPELTKDLQKYLTKTKHPLSSFQEIKGMKVVKRSNSGRILQLDVTTDLGIVKLEKNEVRSAFTPPRSTLFYLEPFYGQNQKLEGYAFVGGGFGHGVGLSQFGSYNLAQIGWSAQKILQFYYPNTKVEPLNESIVFWKPL